MKLRLNKACLLDHPLSDRLNLMTFVIDLLSQQMVITQSPSMSNNPKILINYLIFTVEEDGGEERERGRGGEEELATDGAQASLGVQQRMVGIVDPDLVIHFDLLIW